MIFRMFDKFVSAEKQKKCFFSELFGSSSPLGGNLTAGFQWKHNLLRHGSKSNSGGGCVGASSSLNYVFELEVLALLGGFPTMKIAETPYAAVFDIVV